MPPHRRLDARPDIYVILLTRPPPRSIPPPPTGFRRRPLFLPKESGLFHYLGLYSSRSVRQATVSKTTPNAARTRHDCQKIASVGVAVGGRCLEGSTAQAW